MLPWNDALTRESREGPRRLWAVRCMAERAEIARVLGENDYNRTRTAGVLGISRRTLLNKMKSYGLTVANSRHFAESLLPPPPPPESKHDFAPPMAEA